MNNSNSGTFTVFTGVQNFSRIHLVDNWNGLTKVRGQRTAPTHGEEGVRRGGRVASEGGTCHGGEGHSEP
jgi:hypothetical protein